MVLRGDVHDLRKGFGLGAKLGKGGEGSVFAIIGDTSVVAKIIHAEKLAKDPTMEARIRAMIAHRPAGWRDAYGHVVLAWPQALVLDGGKFAGFVMPRVDLATVAEINMVEDPSERQRPGKGTPGWVPNVSFQDLVGVARNLSAAAAAVHSVDCVVGDFNERNVLVANDARVTFVDCDSMQVPASSGKVYYCSVARADYTAPELIGKDLAATIRHETSDRFALAVHIHQLLLGNAHPFDGLWSGQGDKPARQALATRGLWVYDASSTLKPPKSLIPVDLLPPEVRDLFHRAFVRGAKKPSVRPSAAEWQSKLAEMFPSLKACKHVKGHWYPPHSNRCPWCAHDRKPATNSSTQQVPITPVQSRPPQPAPARLPSPPASHILKPLTPTSIGVTSTPPPSVPPSAAPLRRRAPIMLAGLVTATSGFLPIALRGARWPSGYTPVGPASWKIGQSLQWTIGDTAISVWATLTFLALLGASWGRAHWQKLAAIGFLLSAVTTASQLGSILDRIEFDEDSMLELAATALTSVLVLASLIARRARAALLLVPLAAVMASPPAWSAYASETERPPAVGAKSAPSDGGDVGTTDVASGAPVPNPLELPPDQRPVLDQASTASGDPTVSSLVTWVQYILISGGNSSVTASGFYDAPTEAGVRTFQELFQLPVTGQVDAATWGALDYVVAKANG